MEEIVPAVPLYKRVHDTLVERIVSGDLRPGTMLPSEFNLGTELGVSQGTVRKALIALEAAGLVKRQQGRGTFVAATTPETAMFHFFRLHRIDGTQATPEPARETVRTRAASAREVAAFGIGRIIGRIRVFEIRRIRKIDGRIASREMVVLPAEKFPGLGERGVLPNALYPLYEQSYGITIARAEETIRARAADAETAADLAVMPGHPILEVTRRAIGINDAVIEFRFSQFLTDSLTYDVVLK